MRIHITGQPHPSARVRASYGQPHRRSGAGAAERYSNSSEVCSMSCSASTLAPASNLMRAIR